MADDEAPLDLKSDIAVLRELFDATGGGERDRHWSQGVASFGTRLNPAPEPRDYADADAARAELEEDVLPRDVPFLPYEVPSTARPQEESAGLIGWGFLVPGRALAIGTEWAGLCVISSSSSVPAVRAARGAHPGDVHDGEVPRRGHGRAQGAGDQVHVLRDRAAQPAAERLDGLASDNTRCFFYLPATR